MPQQHSRLAVVTLVVGAVLGAGLVLVVLGPAAPGTGNATADQTDTNHDGPVSPVLSSSAADVTQFENASTYEAYVRAGNRRTDTGFVGGLVRPRVSLNAGDTTVAGEPAAEPDAAAEDAPADQSAPSRIADTNVQVASLDEPDVVKTDGRHFYYAPQRQHYRVRPEPRPSGDTASSRPPRKRVTPNTHVIDASDPEAPEVVSELNTSGKLLQTGDRLVVFEDDRVVGYDVSDPDDPTET